MFQAKNKNKKKKQKKNKTKKKLNICMRCTIERLDEFKGRTLVSLPHKNAKSRTITNAVHIVLCKLVYWFWESRYYRTIFIVIYLQISMKIIKLKNEFYPFFHINAINQGQLLLHEYTKCQKHL